MFDIMKLSPQQLDAYIHAQATIDRQEKQATKTRALRLYYDGEHGSLLTKRQTEFLGALVENEEFPFAHNLVKSVVDTLRERLCVTGVTVHNEATQEGDENLIGVAMWEWWEASRLDAQQIRLYRRALRDSAAYVIVDFDSEAGVPKFNLHKLDAGEKEPGIVVHRDPNDENKIMYASRYWVTDVDPLQPGKQGVERKTVYLPDRILKYVRSSSASGPPWVAIVDEGDASWPIPWVDRQGKPLGVAVIEFQNPGGSEIEQIIPLQNGLNKSWLDLFAAADASGFPVVVVSYQTNGNVPINQTQDDADDEGADELRLSPGRLIEVNDATVTRMQPGDMSQIISVIDRTEQAISGVSRTPIYYLKPLGGDVPSGEALKQLESGLVRRAEERQLVFGQSWQDAFALAYRVNQVYGVRLPEQPKLSIDITWQDANVRNELAITQVAEAHQRLGIPQEEIWKELGKTPEQIAEFKNGQMADTQAKVAAVAAAMRVTQTASNVPTGRAQTGVNGNNGTSVQDTQGQV